MTSTLKFSDLPGSDDARVFIGADAGDVPISMFLIDAPAGDGPKLHRHPYAEIFVVHAGEAEFAVDEQSLTAVAGDVVIAPTGSAHRFTSVGAERLRLTAIHAAARMETEWLPDGAGSLAPAT